MYQKLFRTVLSYRLKIQYYNKKKRNSNNYLYLEVAK